MIFFFNNNGEIIKFSPEHVYQGSNAASKIYFVAPFSAGASVQVAFQLPTGERTQKQAMSILSGTGLDGVETPDGVGFNLWGFDLTEELTAYAGELQVQFFIYIVDAITGNTVGTIATQSAEITIEKGTAPIVAPPAEGDSYAAIMAWLTSFNTYAESRLDTLESVASVIDTQTITISDLSAGVYKLTYAGTKYLYGVPSLPLMYLTGNAPVLLFVSEREDGKDWVIFRQETADGLRVWYGTENTINYVDLDKFLYDISAYVKDNLDYSTAGTTYALSAYQGYVLKGLIDTINSKIPTDATSSNKLADKAWVTDNFTQKVSGAVNGNFAGVDGDGNVTDSGYKASDFTTPAQVAAAIAAAISSAYKAQGTASVSTLNGLTKAESLNGYVYDLTDAGNLTNSDSTTTSVVAGDNVVFIWNGGAWKWDKLSGIIDLSGYVQKTTKIAGIDLADDITKSELWNALDLTTEFAKYVLKTQTIAGIALSGNISAQTLTDSLVLMNTTTDLDYVMGE